MEPTRWQKVEEIFAEVQDLAPDERARRLDERCGDDPELRAEIEQLLYFDDPQRSIEGRIRDAAADVAQRALAPPAEDDAERLIGRLIGPYRLLEVVGRGGFGTVFRAEQNEPLQRTVALKLAHATHLSSTGRARFEREGQTLAMLDHPNVARIFDAGVDEQGRGYLAMEFVEGETVARYCRARNLTVEQRLRLFGQVCHGVFAAHQRGIIHRDIKPSNVLVSEHAEGPRAQVIDFGIAKTIAGDKGNEALTRRMQVVGTLEYMSPEQASLDETEVDTRSDVYGLGALLYELLTDRPPFSREELSSTSASEALRIVRETEPPRPSKLSDDPKRQRALSGELDWIVLRAMAKEPAERYATVSDLVQDVDRHLSGRPVLARAPSRAYQLEKFVRRHRVEAFAVAAVLLALVGGLVASTISLRRASRERDRAIAAEEQAIRSARESEEVSRFLVDLFQGADPEVARGETITAREILDLGSRRIAEIDDDRVGSRLRSVMGNVYLGLGLYDRAEPLLDRALSSSEGAPELQIERALDLADLRLRQNRTDEARELTEQALTLCADVEPVTAREDLRADILSQRADIDYWQGRLVEMAETVDEVLELREARLAQARQLDQETDAPTLAEAKIKVADVLHQKKDLLATRRELFEAEPIMERALQLYEEALPPSHPRILDTRGDLAWVRGYLRDESSAELAAEVVEQTREIYGDDHPAYAHALSYLGNAHYRATRNHEAALEAFTTARDIYSRLLGDDHRLTISMVRQRGFVLMALKRFDEGIAAGRRVLEALRRQLGEDHGDVIVQHFNLGVAYLQAGRWRESLPHLREHLRAYGEDWFDNYRSDNVMRALARAHTQLGDFEEAERLLLRAAELTAEQYGKHVSLYRTEGEELIALYEKWDRPDQIAYWRSEIQASQAEADAREAAKQAEGAEETKS